MKAKRMEGLDLKAILADAQEKLTTSSSGNSTATMITGILPTILLESLIPGYGYIHKIVFQTIGFDITILVTLAIALWLSNKVYSYLYSFAWDFLTSYYMADVSISSRDEIHDQVIEYLAHKYKMRPSRSLMAETPRRGYWDLENDKTVTRSTIDSNGSVQWLNFANQDAKTEPQFTPAIGSHNFWHNRTYFRVKRQEVVVFKTSSYADNPISDQEKLIISCFGRSTEPIKRFLQEAKDHAHRNHSAKTVIRRPATKERRGWGGRSAWTEVARRPCRPMNTVVLDENVKYQVMLDINEYLDPSTARWYAIRGIPYRRGYLLHGPPGTGKTSLTFALAGVFGLNIYVVSLLEPTLTEEELGNLFTHLPPRCIVLLEDIDTAGLARVEQKEETPEESSDEDDTDPIDENQDGFTMLAQLLLKNSKANKYRKAGKGGKGKSHKRTTGGKEKDDEKKGISLSGLLNIIDGVASHEGRVLIMTTNHPEKLDEALIRPGRVDLQVAFTNATRYQAQEIFKRMYSNDPPPHEAQVLHKLQNHVSEPLKIPKVKKPAVIAEKINKLLSEKRPLTPPYTPLSARSENGAETENDKGTTVLRSRTPELAGEHMATLGEVRDVLQPGELESMAREFSEHIEDLMFSPAEIQGFLLTRKKHPRKAILEIAAWVENKKKEKLEGGQKFGKHEEAAVA